MSITEWKLRYGMKSCLCPQCGRMKIHLKVWLKKIFFSSGCGNLKSIIYSFSIMSLLPLGLGTTLQSAACERKI